MPRLDTPSIIKALREFGQRAALRGGNPYRAKAYAGAADSLATLSVPLDQLVLEQRLTEIPGIGDAIADIITKLHKTGSHPGLEKMRKEFPAGVLEMLAIPGLRPDKGVKIFKTLGIESLAELEEAARADRIRETKGLGASLQNKILQNIEMVRTGQNRWHVHRAAALLKNAERSLRAAQPDLERITAAGDFRRGCELIGDLTLVAQTPKLAGPPIERASNGQFTVHLTDEARYGATLLHATGSSAHFEALQKMARAKSLILDQSGLRRGRKVIAAESEADIYKALGLPFIEPELREGRGEIERAMKGKLPKLTTDEDIRGILHAHTNASDGVDTLEVMARATLERGYEYFGVSDHSKSAHYAGGLSVEKITKQHRAVERLNKSFGKDFRILKGIESDILADGSLDYSDPVLARFDFVVASIHGQFRLDKKAQTERLLRAIANPYTTILGHMTGRQLLRRPGYEVGIETVLKSCAAHGVAVEINANPWRLDLDWRWHEKALAFGCMMSINPDAHSTNELDLTHWGVEMARKGGVPAGRVLNCLSLDELLHYLDRRKKAHRQAA
jgi:DNA polymerase (family 10)